MSEPIFPNRGIDNPPRIGESFKNRIKLWEAFGGQRYKGIWQFPGEEVVNVYSGEDSPYPDFVDLETGVIEYRGQGLSGNQKIADGNKLLETARINRSAVRYWHQPSKGEITFKQWVIVADRTTIFENDFDDNSAERILWFLVPVGSNRENEWPKEVVEAEVISLPIDEKAIPRNPDLLLKKYAQLSQLLQQESAASTVSARSRRTFKRRKDARDLVLARSGQQCEYVKCGGMPVDTDQHGMALLEVDHIKPLAEGGPDIPSNMIALCPNCHVAKTRGKNAAQMTSELKRIVAKKEAELLG
jgi:5-methylcytosine-specific restriction protein A